MKSRLRVSYYAYAVATWLFVVGILMQVFLIGLSLLGRQATWQIHIGLGHGLAIAPLLMVVLAYIGRMPRPMKPLTWLALVIYVLLADVVIFMRDSAPLVAAFHPVLAVVLFGITGFLAIRTWRLVREPTDTSVISRPTVEAAGD